MIECMEDMDLYWECQKVLLVDGDQSNVTPEGWEVVCVPRQGDFNWSRMWNEGVSASRNDIVVYLDSDRVLPNNYLTTVRDRIEDDAFLFTQDLFTFKEDVDTGLIKSIRDRTDPDLLRKRYDTYKEFLWYDPRYCLPGHGPGKGVMSGGTAFTKRTFEKSGGVDPFYRGHGAYADSDFHQQCWAMGMDMVNLGLLELHIHHEKFSGEGRLSRRDLEVLSLNNYIYYCLKWGFDFDRARYIADCLQLPKDFVKRVRQTFEAGTPPHADFVPLLG